VPPIIKNSASGDSVIENVNARINIVFAAMNTILAANIENLTLTGNVVSNGIGNDLDNILIGHNRNHIWVSGLGDDTRFLGLDSNLNTVIYHQGDGSDPVNQFDRTCNQLVFNNAAAVAVVPNGSNTFIGLSAAGASFRCS
jgi:hypothetical protein